MEHLGRGSSLLDDYEFEEKGMARRSRLFSSSRMRFEWISGFGTVSVDYGVVVAGGVGGRRGAG